MTKFIKKLINEEIKQILESFRGFSLSKMKQLKNSTEMIEYAKKYLPYLGSGASRTVFGWKAGKVIKIASDLAHNQNMEEVKAFLTPKLSKFLPKIFDYDTENFRWIVAEGVQVIEDTSHLRKLFTTTYDQLGRFVTEAFSEEFNQAVENTFSPEETEKLTEHDFELLESIYLLTQEDVEDIDRFDHWGFTNKGRLVLVDAGFALDL